MNSAMNGALNSNVTTRTVIAGALVADLAAGGTERRDIVVENGLIAALVAPGTAEVAGSTSIDGTDRLILPGFVNSHTHGHANLVKGVADRWTLEASLTNAPWLGGARNAETMYLSTLIGALDMVSKGCTACFDLVYEFPRPTVEGLHAVARAYADAGMKAVLAPMVADRSLFTAIPGLLDALPDDLRAEVSSLALGDGQATLDALAAIVASQPSLPKGISLALAPTIPHHCSEAFLDGVVRLAREKALPIHMHVAESRLQATTALKLWGKSPVAFLAERGVLGADFIAAHSVWLSGADLDLLAEHGAAIAHIPASNFRLGAGVAPVRAMLERGLRVGLATDGANSSDALSMPLAIRLASYASRIIDRPREDWLGAVETLRLATEGGASLPGFGGGSRIEVGAAADLVMFDLTHIDFLPLRDPLNQVVTAADSGAISDVMIDGRLVLQDKRFAGVEPAALRIRAAEAIAGLDRHLAGTRDLAARLEPHVVAFARAESRVALPFQRLISPEEGSLP